MGLECSRHTGFGNTENEAAKAHAQNIANMQFQVYFPHVSERYMFIKNHGLYEIDIKRLCDCRRDSHIDCIGQYRRYTAVGKKIGEQPLIEYDTNDFMTMY